MLSDTQQTHSPIDEAYGARSAPTRLQPIALTAERSPSAAYPVEALGPVLGAAVAATSSHVMAPVAIAAQSCLCACSLGVQGHFDVLLPTGETRPTSLHGITVAESGERKSATDNQMMQPIWAFQDSLEDVHREQQTAVALSQAAWDEARKAVTHQMKNRGREALEEGYRDLGPRPEGPLDPTMVVRSGTTQAMLKQFKTSRPSLGLMSDEGGSWLGGYGMTEDNRLLTISTLSDFWDGKSVQINTAGEGFTALRGRRLALHMMIQPIVASRLLGNAEAQGQGFLSRLLVTHPESLAGTRFVDPAKRDQAAYEAAVAPYRQRLGQIVAAPLPMMEGTTILQPRPLPLSAAAQAMWWAFYNQIEGRLGEGGDLRDVKGFVGKLPEQAARIAAVLAVFDQGYAIQEISAEAMARGIALAEYYLSEAQRLFGQAPIDPVLEHAKLLSEWLRDGWKEPLTSITSALQGGPKPLRKGGDYMQTLFDVLVRHDHLAGPLPDGGMIAGKKVRKVWRVMCRD